MNPTLYRTEWVSQEGWDEPLEGNVHAGFRNRETKSESAFVGKHNPTDGVISVLNRLYEFRGGLVVEGFLRENLPQNPYMAGVLLVAQDRIHDRFGLGARAILEVVTDPDAPSDQQLFIIIRTRFPAKIARDLLSVLREGWWRTLPRAARRKLELDVE
jgi:hypothetical protein